MDKKAFFNWSSGKDSAMALYSLKMEGKQKVDLLLTAVNQKYQRVSMHGLHRNLLEAQAKSLGLPLEILELPENPSMEDYGRLMNERMLALKGRGFTATYFGDIFLEDLKAYRESMLQPLGFKVIFPLWKKDTKKLMQEFIRFKFKAIVVSVNAQVLDKSFCGRLIDESFLEDLPTNVDPCGENGEFHTFCFDGPIFQRPVPYRNGDVVYKTYPAPKTEKNKGITEYGFWFCDLHLES